MTSVVLITCVCIKRVEFRETVRIFPQGQLNCPYQEGVSIGEGGGGGVSKNFYTGRLRPEVQPLTLLCTIFHEKGTPFVYLLLTNGTPFTYLV